VGNWVILHLVGNLRIEHLDELKAQIGAAGRKIALDVGGVSLISIEGIRFLNCCESSGISIKSASPYISVWMTLEQKFSHKRQNK
jgi:hypothetical protein